MIWSALLLLDWGCIRLSTSFYEDSVGFEGLIAASDMLGEPRWFAFAHGFFRVWATRMLPFQPDDNTAPGPAMSMVIERTGDTVLPEAVIALARDLRGAGLGWAGFGDVWGFASVIADALRRGHFVGCGGGTDAGPRPWYLA